MRKVKPSRGRVVFLTSDLAYFFLKNFFFLRLFNSQKVRLEVRGGFGPLGLGNGLSYKNSTLIIVTI
jgi:hypothetical protein